MTLSGVTMESASLMHLGSAMAGLNVMMVQMRQTAVSIMHYPDDLQHGQIRELDISILFGLLKSPDWLSAMH